MELRDDGMCFVCGRSNPIGLRLGFGFEEGKYVTRFTPAREHQGYEGVTHGGIVAAVLDEVMARLVYALGHRAPTAELKVRFKRPAFTSEELTVRGWVTSEQGRLIECAGEARSPSGELVAEAVAKMLKVSGSGDDSMAEPKFVVVDRPRDEVTANIIKSTLETAGIPAIVRPYHTSWFDGVFVPAEGAWGDLLVSEEHADEARALLAARPGQAGEEEIEDDTSS